MTDTAWVSFFTLVMLSQDKSKLKKIYRSKKPADPDPYCFLPNMWAYIEKIELSEYIVYNKKKEHHI